MGTPPVRLSPAADARVPVHFVFRRDGELEYRIACMPAAMELSLKAGRPLSLPRTDDPRAVACEFCRSTEDFRAEARRRGYAELLP